MNKKMSLVLATLILPLKLFGMDGAATTESFPEIKIIKCQERCLNKLVTDGAEIKWVSLPENWVWDPKKDCFYLNRQLNFFREEKGFYHNTVEEANIVFSLSANKEELQIIEMHPQAINSQDNLKTHSYKLTKNFSFVLNSKNWLCCCLLDNTRKIELIKFSKMGHYDFPEELNRGIFPATLSQ